MTYSSTNIHPQKDAVFIAECMRFNTTGDETFALRIGPKHHPCATFFLTKEQLASLCRDMEVLYMVEILGASEKEVRS